MNAQPENLMKRWATIVVLICGIALVSYAVSQTGFMRLRQLTAASRPMQFWGDWSAVGIQGDSRGIITFAPNGRIDSHDDYLGKWWFESGTIHVQFWKADAPSPIEYLFPKRDEFVFAILRDQENRPSAMQGVNVVLTPTAVVSQQRALPNKAVNPSGGSAEY